MGSNIHECAANRQVLLNYRQAFLFPLPVVIKSPTRQQIFRVKQHMDARLDFHPNRHKGLEHSPQMPWSVATAV
jgi:hypothetical protein